MKKSISSTTLSRETILCKVNRRNNQTRSHSTKEAAQASWEKWQGPQLRELSVPCCCQSRTGPSLVPAHCRCFFRFQWQEEMSFSSRVSKQSSGPQRRSSKCGEQSGRAVMDKSFHREPWKHGQWVMEATSEDSENGWFKQPCKGIYKAHSAASSGNNPPLISWNNQLMASRVSEWEQGETKPGSDTATDVQNNEHNLSCKVKIGDL